MKKITIETIPHEAQRYDTCGDYYDMDDTKKIMVSMLDNHDYEFLIGIHEAIEAYLVERKGVSIEEIDRFDMEFKGEGEPGDNPDAPYHKEHVFVTWIERLIAYNLGVDWQEYEKSIGKLTR